MLQALFSAMSVMVAGSTASMLLSVCLSLRVGDGFGKCFMPFYRAECAALIRLQVITLSEQVLALDLACAVGAFVSLPIAFLFSHLFLQLSSPLPPSYCHAHACARGDSGWWGRHFSPDCLAEFLLCSGLDSVFLALEHVRAPFAAFPPPPLARGDWACH